MVADRFCFGSFPGRQEIHIGEEEDALKAVCRRYMEDSQCARYMSHEKILARRDFVRPYRAGSSGQMRTRIQAFVERMEIKKIQNQRGGALHG